MGDEAERLVTSESAALVCILRFRKWKVMTKGVSYARIMY